MAIPQQKFREIVFQLLYSFDLGKSEEDHMVPLIMKQLSVTRKAVKEASVRGQKVLAVLPELDKVIGKTSKSYSFERIQSVERNLLRMSVYELLYDPDIPPKVAIAEAVRLARKFGSPESATFVNAVLDAIYKSSQGVKVDPKSIHTSFEKLVHNEKLSQEASLNQKMEEDEDD